MITYRVITTGDLPHDEFNNLPLEEAKKKAMELVLFFIKDNYPAASIDLNWQPSEGYTALYLRYSVDGGAYETGVKIISMY